MASTLDALLDFTRPEFRCDPHPTWARIRALGPLHRVERGRLRFWILSHHDDVVWALRDPRMSVERPMWPRPVEDDGRVDPARLHPLARALRALSRVMLFRDPPDHTRLRGLVSRAFTPRRVEALRPRVAAQVDALLAAGRRAGGLDVVRDLAEPLPIGVVAELLGLPRDDHEELKRWSDDLAAMRDGSIAMQHLGAAVHSAAEVVEYLRGHLGERGGAPRGDLISALLAAKERDERLDDDALLGTALLVMEAGHETTTNAIGNGVLALATASTSVSAPASPASRRSSRSAP
jgi:cytochrome P450